MKTLNPRSIDKKGSLSLVGENDLVKTKLKPIISKKWSLSKGDGDGWERIKAGMTPRGGSGGVPVTGGDLDGAGGERFPLSTTHIRPFIEFYPGASQLKVEKGGDKPEQKGGGMRGKIRGFSKQSRRRLMLMISKIRRDAELPLFVTLTYPEIFPTPEKAKIDITKFFKRLRRRFKKAGLIWKLEPQERGAPHFHILMWGVNLQIARDWIPGNWYEIAGKADRKHLAWHMGLCGNGNVHCVQQVRSWKGVWAYAAKYLGKTFEIAGWERIWTGRYWGVIAGSDIPFAKLTRVELDYRKAVQMMRYQRRYARLKGRDRRSLTIFCDASQWIRRMEL